MISLTIRPELYKGFNLIPMRSDRASPLVEEWTSYQTKPYPQREIDYSKNYGVILGKISFNLIDVEFDLPTEDKKLGTCLSELQTAVLYNWVVDKYPYLQNKLTIRTKSGMLRFLVKLPNMNLMEKNKYEISIGETFQGHTLDNEKVQGFVLEHMEIRGNSHFSALAPSKMDDGREYTIYKHFLPSRITEEEFKDLLGNHIVEQPIIKEQPIEKPKSKPEQPKQQKITESYQFRPAKFVCSRYPLFPEVREPFLYIFEGRIEIESYARLHQQLEHIYWQSTYAEIMKKSTLSEKAFLDVLEQTQPAFSRKTWNEQLRYKKDVLPLTKDKMKCYFPEFPECYEDNYIKPRTKLLDLGAEKIDNNVLIDMICDNILENFHIITLENSRELYTFKDNHYTKKTKEFKLYLTDILRRLRKTSYRFSKSDIIEELKDLTLIEEDDLINNSWEINYKNGYYDAKENKWYPINKDSWKRYILYAIDQNFDPYFKGTRIGSNLVYCPRYKLALKEWLYEKEYCSKVGKIDKKEQYLYEWNEEKQDFNMYYYKPRTALTDDIFEALGYCMQPNTSFKKAFINFGKSNTGKTQQTNLIKEMFGNENYKGETLYRLSRNDFSIYNLRNILLNITGEMPKQKIMNNDRIKQIIGGETDMGTDVKHKQEYLNIIIMIHLWFDTNFLPELDNIEDDAFFNRFVIFDHLNTFDKNQIVDFWKNIYNDKEEIQGILHEIHRGLRRLIKRNKFRPILSEKTKETWLYHTEPIYKFMVDNCNMEGNMQYEQESLFEDFKDYIEINGIKFNYSNDSALKGILTKFLTKFGIKKSKVGPRENRYWVYLGIAPKKSFLNHLIDKKVIEY